MNTHLFLGHAPQDRPRPNKTKTNSLLNAVRKEFQITIANRFAKMIQQNGILILINCDLNTYL